MIAGHEFRDVFGRRECECGRLWVQIASATKADLGCPNIAHQGALNDRELEEIIAERERIFAAVADVVGRSR